MKSANIEGPAVALTFDDTQRNAPRSPLFTPAMLAALLSETEKAHAAYVVDVGRLLSPRMAPQDVHDIIAGENARWAEWYAEYMAPRLNASASAAMWTPIPTQDVPPFAPLSSQLDAYWQEEATARAARHDGDELRHGETTTDVDA